MDWHARTTTVLDLTRSYNLRELGGYQTVDGKSVKWHKLLRSGSLNALTATDIEDLLNYGVAYDVDFRSRHEIKVAPDPFDDNQLTYHRLSVFPFTDQADTPKKPAKKRLMRLFSKKRSCYSRTIKYGSDVPTIDHRLPCSSSLSRFIYRTIK